MGALLFFPENVREAENVRGASETYDAIKEGGSTRILGHLMRVSASGYFFALRHLVNFYYYYTIANYEIFTFFFYTKFPK